MRRRRALSRKSQPGKFRETTHGQDAARRQRPAYAMARPVHPLANAWRPGTNALIDLGGLHPWRTEPEHNEQDQHELDPAETGWDEVESERL
jgi:hypothetical protein